MLGNGYGDWIRPVSNRPTEEIRLEEYRYENGREARVLDVIEIPMIAPGPRAHQTENHVIDAGKRWSRKSALAMTDLPSLVERPASLWLNGYSTYHGKNDCVPETHAGQFSNSLFLIMPETLNVRVQTENVMSGPAKKRVRAEFTYNGTGYNFIVTDIATEQAFLLRDEGVFPITGAYMCVSLTQAYEGDGRCHKLVATIIG